MEIGKGCKRRLRRKWKTRSPVTVCTSFGEECKRWLRRKWKRRLPVTVLAVNDARISKQKRVSAAFRPVKGNLHLKNAAPRCNSDPRCISDLRARKRRFRSVSDPQIETAFSFSPARVKVAKEEAAMKKEEKETEHSFEARGEGALKWGSGCTGTTQFYQRQRRLSRRAT